MASHASHASLPSHEDERFTRRGVSRRKNGPCAYRLLTATTRLGNGSQNDRGVQSTISFEINYLVDGAPEEIRTPDPQIRSLVLYPAELRARRFA
jgi:hypothetical protein